MKEGDSNWLSNLKTHSSFDSGPGSSTMAIDTICGEVQSFSASSILVESLIYQLCKLIENESTKQKNLYLKICQKLHEMNLIDQSYDIEELQSLRSYYQKALYQLVTVAKAAGVGKETQALLPKLNQHVQETLKSPFEWSRYSEEYEELEFIAGGGFGKVFKARHKLDGGVYAVKKIILRYRTVNTFMKNLKEVKMLAHLNHPNIVAYKAAWLEPLHTKKNTQVVILNESQKSEFTKMQDSSSGNVVFENSDSFTKDDSNNKLLCHTTTTTTVSKAKHVWKYAQEETGNQGSAILYVQMQLCQETLRNWLDSRNRNLVVAPLEEMFCLQMFKHIVQGIDYIHSQGIVHHDIKPSNIFISQDLRVVQVGDFGLACSLLSCNTDLQVNLVSEHHGNQIGTKLYAAPEQLKGVCTFKSDIYSLGIVLFELVHPFQTDMERYKVIGQLRGGHIPMDLAASYPSLVHIISQTVCNSKRKRPSATELILKLDSEGISINNKIIAEKDDTIRKLHSEVSLRDKEIEELRQQLSQLKYHSSTS